jgi:hypothetical protein
LRPVGNAIKIQHGKLSIGEIAIAKESATIMRKIEKKTEELHISDLPYKSQ